MLAADPAEAGDLHVANQVDPPISGGILRTGTRNSASFGMRFGAASIRTARSGRRLAVAAG